LIFDKASLRTRVSFTVGIQNLGGHGIYLAPSDIRMGEREPVKDVARTTSRMVQAIAARLTSDDLIAELAKVGLRSRHQRADRPRASLPGAG